MENKTKKRILIAVILLLLALGTAVIFMTPGPEPPDMPGDVIPTPTPEPTPEPMMTPTNNTTSHGAAQLPDDTPMDVCDPRHSAAWLYAHDCYGSGGGSRSRSTPPAVPRGVNIEVDGEDPWDAVYSGNLSGMLPYCTRYIEFPVTNIGKETAKIWKRIMITNETGGDPVYAGLASSEPEYTECGGFTTEGYIEQCDLSNYMVYELHINDHMIIDGMLSEMNNTWTYLGELPKGQTMVVNQSYRLQGVTSNWAQGDVVEFDIELYAVSLDGGDPL